MTYVSSHPMVTMKKAFATGMAGFLLAASAAGQTPLVENFGTLDFPPSGPLNATQIINRGNINAGNSFLLWDTQNTLHFENAFSGVMSGSPGFQFDFVTDAGLRFPQAGFTNNGSISATEHILISATNVVVNNLGLLTTDSFGRIQVLGQSIDLFNARMRAGDASSGFLSEGFINTARTRYTLPSNIAEDVWGVGTLGGESLPGIAFGGQAGFSPDHPVIFRGLGTGRDVTSIGSGFSFFVITNNFRRLNATTVNNTIQMVLVNTNAIDSPRMQVFFDNARSVNNFTVRDAVVQWALDDIDPISGQPILRVLQFRDAGPRVADVSAAGIGTNFDLAENINSPSRFSPSPFTWSRFSSTPGFFTGGATPDLYDPNLIFTTRNPNVNGRYANDVAAVESAGATLRLLPYNLSNGGLGSGNGSGAAQSFTNSPGRIEIVATNGASTVNMSFSRMKAENLLSVTAQNINLDGAVIDAPNVRIEQLSTSSNLVLSNNLDNVVQRLNGQIQVWSGVWQIDQFVTNGTVNPGLPPLAGNNTLQYIYHMVIIDSALSTNTPVLLQSLLSGGNVDLGDQVNVDGGFFMGGTSWTVQTNASFTFNQAGAAFTRTNAPNLNNLTNLGTISIPGDGNFGNDRSAPYSNIVNHGIFNGSALQFRAHQFQNTGSISGFGGSVSIQADTNQLMGGTIFANQGIRLSGKDLTFTNTLLSSGTTMILDVTDRVSDRDVTNTWTLNGGITQLQRATKGDLLSTRLLSVAGAGLDNLHFWAAENRGDDPAGYLNNQAVGRLTLDGAAGSRFVFGGQTGSNGLYVSHIELLNNATNFTTALTVFPSLTIFFNSANVPEDKLTNAHNGRLVWVSPTTFPASPFVSIPTSFSGSTNLTLQQFRALLPGFDDFDGDGIPNDQDTMPLSGFTVNNIWVAPLPPSNVLTSFISWQAMAGRRYFLEYKTSLQSTNWSALKEVVAAQDGTLTEIDPVPAQGQRYYRVRY